MKHTAENWIRALKLRPHPEGGWFRETYRSRETIAGAHLPKRYQGPRAFGTAIYFLLKAGQFSALHRLKSDELWHFYAGAPVEIFILPGNGALKKVKLGLNPEAGERPQVVIAANVWLAAALVRQNHQPQAEASPKAASRRAGPPLAEKSYALLGCTMAPGFDFSDFELGAGQELCRRFPRHQALIKKMTLKP